MPAFLARNRGSLLLAGLFVLAVLAATLLAERPDRLHGDLTGVEALVGPGGAPGAAVEGADGGAAD